jgi:hypothetical protein
MARYLVLLLALATTALWASPAGAAPKKDYTVTVSSAFAGDTVDYTLTITNRAGTQQLGSANLTIPGAIGLGADGAVSASVSPRGTATSSATDPRVIELRSLALLDGESATVTLAGLEMPCVGNPVWPVPPAKQSNDFSGLPGNTMSFDSAGSDLTTDLLGQCTLVFAAQPQGAQKTESIRSAEFEPVNGPPVQVGAIDAKGGDPVPALDPPITIGLGGTGSGRLSQSASDPVDVGARLSFFGLSVDAPGTYQLTAAKAGYISGTSRPFVIFDEEQPCNNARCDATLTGNRASTKVQGALVAGDAGHVLLSRSVGSRPECPGYVSPLGNGEWYEFALTVARSKTVTVTYTKAAMQSVPGGHSGLEICLSSPESFVAKGGTRLFNYDDLDGDPLDGVVGLLLDCADAPLGEPCILDRSPAGGGRAVVTFFVPGRLGDPRHW